MISFYLVDVQSITSNLPRSNFSEHEIENLADIILECDGLVKPLLLKQVEIEKYEVIDGDLEYYAAVRAREKNPRQAEMVNSLVISSKVEDLVLKQAEALKPKTPPPLPDSGGETPAPSNAESRLSNFDFRLINMESRLDNIINEVKGQLSSQNQALEARIQELERRIPEPIPPLLDALNTMSIAQLGTRLNKAGVSQRVINNIEKERNQKQFQPFESFSDVIKRIDGLGDKTMIKIIDSWQDRS
ncbi:MAG: chromosome partitioning protein ParB [Okeania sp. SIO3H1]|uniref:ParB N-terminal domain-containing protein n=1 Tax=Okeania sp. SIO1I7 TaxID=2607772 RepID=UPI0013C9D605|nr:hypothetical protein [Okeania sp. SIO1I7]NEN92828.1 chromosome partitioning protein ParB [Okeania sp. SIO3H1]NET28437.1 chromosome partitioning protein ParB [Okeania sp. SIO1I7]